MSLFQGWLINKSNSTYNLNSQIMFYFNINFVVFMLFNNKLPQTSFWKRQWKMDPNLLKNINYGQTVWWYRSQKVVLWFSFYLHLTMKIKRVGCFNELITLNPISFFSELTVHFTRFPIQSLKVERTELTTILVIYSCLPSYLWI